MRLLITGGLGYLGGRLAQSLADRSDFEVFLGSRSPPNPLVPSISNARMVQMHWDSPSDLEQICHGMDVLVHLAGINAEDCAADPISALAFNGLATARLLKAAVRQGVRRFIYLSTAHVYGSPLAGMITEETCPVSLQPYATSHRAAEDVVRAALQRGETEGIVIRLSNAYGAPVSKDTRCWNLLVNDLCRQVVVNRRLVLKSSGLQRRDFIPLTDACRAIGHLIDMPSHKIGKGLFNLGGEWSPTVFEMAHLVRERCTEILGFAPEIRRVPPQVEESSFELDYRIDSLRQIGYDPGLDKTGEVDRLLVFCRATFA